MLNQWMVTRTVPMELRLRVAAPVRGEKRDQIFIFNSLTGLRVVTGSSDTRFQALLQGTKFLPSRNRADERYQLLRLNPDELIQLGFGEGDIRHMVLAGLGEKWSAARCALARELRDERLVQRWPCALDFA